jgi:hypothetical protein
MAKWDAPVRLIWENRSVPYLVSVFSFGRVYPVPSHHNLQIKLTSAACGLPSYLEDDGEAVMATAENKRPRLSSGAEKKPSRKEVLLFSLLSSIELASLSSYFLRRLPCLPLPPLIMHTCAIG